MDSADTTLLLVSALTFFLVLCFFTRKNGRPWNWPIVGMLPTTLLNFNRIFDLFTEILEQNNGTFVIRPWFSKKGKVITCDPANLSHVFSSSFSIYPKGARSKRNFDVLGDILFNADSDEWRKHRAMAQSFFTNKRFYQQIPKFTKSILEKGLVPILEDVSEQGLIIDLQDMLQRFTFDVTCIIVTGYDPGSLRLGFPENPFFKAMDEATQVIFLRNVLPERLWKLQRKLGIGAEKRMAKAREILESIAAKYISRKMEDLRTNKDIVATGYDALTSQMTDEEASGSIGNTYSALRDTVIGLMFAGRDTSSLTLAWFFWLLSKNPSAEFKILQELKANLGEKEGTLHLFFKTEELSKLVYLHAALCETLRLHPPVPFQSRIPIQSDTLPSGQVVGPGMVVLPCAYAMGRMKSVWGEDCCEFKPERWINDKGKIKAVPSSKFPAFSSGPRICPGKEVAFLTMKAVAATIIFGYQVQILKDHPVLPVTSIVLHMKHGLKAKITKRDGHQA